MKVEHREGDPRDLKLLEDNARYMRYEVFQRLVTQVRKDGTLQQWPFVYLDQATGERVVLSGNHRVKAAIEAGLHRIDWIECDQPLSRDEQVRIQLAHNAIVGEDDPESLRRLYESIGDVEERLMSGLDDAALDLLGDASAAKLSEVNLDYSTVNIVFLPDEYERALKAFDEARQIGGRLEAYWAARDNQHAQVLDALEDARAASHVMNTATALDVLLRVWDEHRTDLLDEWLTEGGELRRSSKAQDVPIASITGPNIPARAGQVIAKAVRKYMAQHPEVKTAGDALAALVTGEAKESGA